VIDAIDEAIRTLIRRDALNGGEIEVVFDAPNKDWAARRNAPTINVYLYDIREDLKWRAYGTTEYRDGSTGFVTARQPPPRHFKFSYLVTAWTQRPEDEHRLLSAVLACFLRFTVLPQDVLTGSLDGLKPVVVAIGMPPPDDRPVSDVWTALGGELKPSLDLTVTAPIDPGRTDTDIAPPVLEEPKIRVSSADGAGAEDAPGRTGRRRADAALARPVAVEEVAGGTPEQPGRRIRIRNTSVPGPDPSE
jgi:hypothetical protein